MAGPVAKHLTLRAAQSLNSQNLGNLASALVVASIVILFLYIGRAILEPLVIAALLAFILAPLIRRLRTWGLWRTPAVVLTVIVAIAIIGALGSTIIVQITQLAEDLPKYETNLRAKVRALSGASPHWSLRKASTSVSWLAMPRKPPTKLSDN
jgi:predicted PurR-regulated permease PerM